MELKTHPGFTALVSTHRTKFADLANFVGRVSNELVTMAVQHSLLLGGPIYWAYTGIDGTQQTVFTLDILLPVTGDTHPREALPLKTIEPFTCFATWHYGSWDQLPDTYGKLIQQLQEQGHSMNGLTRECYLNIDFANPANNITEVQVGIG